MFNKEKFLKLVSPEPSTAMQDVKWRIANRKELRIAATLTLQVLDKMDNEAISKSQLSERIKISMYRLNKVMRGKDIMTESEKNKIKKFLGL